MEISVMKAGEDEMRCSQTISEKKRGESLLPSPFVLLGPLVGCMSPVSRGVGQSIYSTEPTNSNASLIREHPQMSPETILNLATL